MSFVCEKCGRMSNRQYARCPYRQAKFNEKKLVYGERRTIKYCYPFETRWKGKIGKKYVKVKVRKR